MKSLAVTFLLICLFSLHASAQKPELRWGEFGCYSNWDRYPYSIDSQYEFIGRLPDLRQFPKLLEAALDPKMDRTDRAIILSQMRTLSRCDFEKTVSNEGHDAEAKYRAAVAKWGDWWRDYGSGLSQSLPLNGSRYKEAWSEVAPSPYSECPDYPISIPESWSSTISFRSGDYGFVTEEVIEFRVSEKDCELLRRYRTGWIGKSNWTYEAWAGFSREEAANFLAVLIYAIDNPWFYGDDKFSAPSSNEERKIDHIRGRPEAWSTYYHGYEWSGILDADQRVIINHDPWNWNTTDKGLGPKRMLDGGVFGVVFRVVRDLFPDPSWEPSGSRWEKIDTLEQNGESSKAEAPTAD